MGDRADLKFFIGKLPANTPDYAGDAVSEIETVLGGVATCVCVLVYATNTDDLKRMLTKDQYATLLPPDAPPLHTHAHHLFSLFTSPLAMWAHGDAHTTGGEGGEKMGCEHVESVCVCIKRPLKSMLHGAFAACLAHVHASGLHVSGLRYVYPTQGAINRAPSLALKNSLSTEHPSLVLSIRGPHAISKWTAIVGPADPVLARRTDRHSLNAVYGGGSRDECFALPVVGHPSKVFQDTVWAFGGRVAHTLSVRGEAARTHSIDPSVSEDEQHTLHALTHIIGDDKNTHTALGGRVQTHALLVSPPRVYSVCVGKVLSAPDELIAFLHSMTSSFGTILSLTPHTHTHPTTLLLTAIREGGASFLLSPPEPFVCVSDTQPDTYAHTHIPLVLLPPSRLTPASQQLALGRPINPPTIAGVGAGAYDTAGSGRRESIGSQHHREHMERAQEMNDAPEVACIALFGSACTADALCEFTTDLFAFPALRYRLTDKLDAHTHMGAPYKIPHGTPPFGGGVEIPSMRVVDLGRLADAHKQIGQAHALYRRGSAGGEAQTQTYTNSSGVQIQTHTNLQSAANLATSVLVSNTRTFKNTPPTRDAITSGVCVLLCVRGEQMASALREYMNRTRARCVLSGCVSITHNTVAARDVWRTFFGPMCPPATQTPHTHLPPIVQTLPLDSPYSEARFETPASTHTHTTAPPSKPSEEEEARLFPESQGRQTACAVVVPSAAGSLNENTRHLLYMCGAQGFELEALRYCSGVKKEVRDVLWEQDTKDGQLGLADLSEFDKHWGGSDASAQQEGGAGCVCVAVSRPHAIKRLARVCGYGEPSANTQRGVAALRAKVGKDRSDCGVRCATTYDNCTALLQNSVGVPEYVSGPSLIDLKKVVPRVVANQQQQQLCMVVCAPNPMQEDAPTLMQMAEEVFSWVSDINKEAPTAADPNVTGVYALKVADMTVIQGGKGGRVRARECAERFRMRRMADSVELPVPLPWLVTLVEGPVCVSKLQSRLKVLRQGAHTPHMLRGGANKEGGGGAMGVLLHFA